MVLHGSAYGAKCQTCGKESYPDDKPEERHKPDCRFAYYLRIAKEATR